LAPKWKIMKTSPSIVIEEIDGNPIQVEHFGKISRYPGFWLVCEYCKIKAWLSVGRWDDISLGIQCQHDWGGERCNGLWEIDHPTARPGYLTTWDEEEFDD
jgi:hypothetical protein